MNDDTHWYWLLGGSAAALLAGLGYASYKAARPAAALTTSTAPFGGTIQSWYTDGAKIHGYLPGNADTEERDITITPLRVVDDVAYTPEFTYYLGEEHRPERLGGGLRPLDY
jgi:hypothetical protein